MARRSIPLKLVCVVCEVPFTSYRNTRWCRPQCRQEERELRRGQASLAADKKNIMLARIEVLVQEFNAANPNQPIKLVAA